MNRQKKVGRGFFFFFLSKVFHPLGFHADISTQWKKETKPVSLDFSSWAFQVGQSNRLSSLYFFCVST